PVLGSQKVPWHGAGAGQSTDPTNTQPRGSASGSPGEQDHCSHRSSCAHSASLSHESTQSGSGCTCWQPKTSLAGSFGAQVSIVQLLGSAQAAALVPVTGGRAVLAPTDPAIKMV